MKANLVGILVAIALWCRPCVALAGEPPPARSKPNIVFILADDLGWRDTSLYGSTFYRTPHIDRLAARGMMFTQAYAASPLCSPTRASIMTGLYPARLGITTPSCHVPEEIFTETVIPRADPTLKALQRQSATRLKLEYYTLAEALKDAGYRTGHFGKWHLGREPYDPLHQGFDVDVPHWYGPGPPGYIAPWKFPPNLHFTGQPGEHIEDRMAQEVVKFIKENKDRPFFVNYWCYSVHSPWGAKAHLIDKYKPLADPKNPQHSPLYAAMVESLDDAVGTVTRTLDELGLAQNTIIVFFSDNGGVDFHELDGAPVTSNLPLRSGKASLYEGGTREPCVVVWPGVVKPGSRSDALIQSIDWYPTLLDAVGLKPKEGLQFDGMSIVRALKGEPLGRDEIFCYFPHYSTSAHPGVYARKGDWKLLRFFFDGPGQVDRLELYNLKDDVGETTDLSAKRPDKVAELAPLLERFLKQTRAVLPARNPDYDEAKEKKKLARIARRKAAPTIGGWKADGDAVLALNDGQLVITADGGDPQIVSGELKVPEGPYVVELRMKSNSKGQGQIFWSAASNPRFGPTQQVRFPVTHDGKWHEYKVKVPLQRPLTYLRIDPSTAPGEMRIEWIRLASAAGTMIKEWRFERPERGKED